MQTVVVFLQQHPGRKQRLAAGRYLAVKIPAERQIASHTNHTGHVTQGEDHAIQI